MLVSFAIETVMASTSAKPAMAALRITPVAPTRSPTMRAATTTNPRNIAKAITDQKAKGLRNAVGDPHVSEKGNAGERDCDKPYLAWIDPAKRADWIIPRR